ncbi:MAG TPA: isochorismate synthase [Acidimicrobiales bacterium]|nr:isochorismate synthase [Acidimicrobiales bacterium]
MATPAPSSATPLSATRRRIPPGAPIDGLALAGSSGIVFDTGDRLLVGLGVALLIPLENGLDSPADLARVRRTLAAIDCDDEAVGIAGIGAPVLAFGALPFDRSERSALIVPEVLYVRRSDGEQWVTVVGRALSGDPRDELVAPRQGISPSTIGAHRPDVDPPIRGAVFHPLSSEDEFLHIVGDAVASIDRGELTKVVLARQVDVSFGRPIDIPDLLRRWRDMEPNCTVFSMPTPKGQFVGASPELLVRRHGDQVASRPLAGTTGLVSDDDASEFRSSVKDGLEHRLVAEAIGRILTPLCSEVELPPEPELVRLHNIIHLGTAIHGRLLRRPTPDNPDGEVPTALDLVSALHPTPAVGGVPTDRAIDTIDKLESDLRGTYAGPVGYVDADGDGHWVVGIRAATLHGSTARLAAGVGIVSGSEPEAELAETALKFTAVFDALAPGLPFTTGQPHQPVLPARP